MIILLERATGLAVNPAVVSSIVIRKSNGYAVLEVRINDGERHTVKHTTHCSDGDDIHAVYTQLLEAR